MRNGSVMRLFERDAHEVLGEQDHVEWSVLLKLAQCRDDDGVEYGRKTIQRAWPSPEAKLETLRRQCVGGKIVGVSAHEAFTVGGPKHMMWVDIDGTDATTVRSWLREQKLIPQDAYAIVPSTTLGSHVYIVTDRQLRENEQPVVLETLRRTMDGSLGKKLDRVYGPFSRRVVFLPRLGLMEAVLPQTLVRGLSGRVRLSRLLA